MIKYTQGNLLEADVDALVNTVNTVGVMGKGIALMFKERFPKNMRAYAQACKHDEVVVGRIFVTDTNELKGVRWIVNFPTKQHWRNPSQLNWVIDGLYDLKAWIIESGIRSIAIPPLGAGNGGLDWQIVRGYIEGILGDLDGVELWVYEPIAQYQNIAKPQGVETLTPARALIVELVRRYWVLGMGCSLLEIQKLVWFLQRVIEQQDLINPLKLRFLAKNYGPYAQNLMGVLDQLDGSYLKADKRIPDASPSDAIEFRQDKATIVQAYLQSEAKDYMPLLDGVSSIIDGFESPYGMELLATIDWLLFEEKCEPTLVGVKAALAQWSAGERWAQRKVNMFSEAHLQIGLNCLLASKLYSS